MTLSVVKSLLGCWRARPTLGIRCRVMCRDGQTLGLRYLTTSNLQIMPSRRAKHCPNGPNEGLLRIISLDFLNDILSVWTLMRQKPCFVSLTVCRVTYRLGYVRNDPSICNQLCKWLSKSVRRLHRLASLTKRANVNIL